MRPVENGGEMHQTRRNPNKPGILVIKLNGEKRAEWR
jgi:hypothetical protein